MSRYSVVTNDVKRSQRFVLNRTTGWGDPLVDGYDLCQPHPCRRPSQTSRKPFLLPQGAPSRQAATMIIATSQSLPHFICASCVSPSQRPQKKTNILQVHVLVDPFLAFGSLDGHRPSIVPAQETVSVAVGAAV